MYLICCHPFEVAPAPCDYCDTSLHKSFTLYWMSTQYDDKKLARADNARNLVESNLLNVVAVSSTSDVLFISSSVLTPFAPKVP